MRGSGDVVGSYALATGGGVILEHMMGGGLWFGQWARIGLVCTQLEKRDIFQGRWGSSVFRASSSNLTY